MEKPAKILFNIIREIQNEKYKLLCLSSLGVDIIKLPDSRRLSDIHSISKLEPRSSRPSRICRLFEQGGKSRVSRRDS